jgi:hypothetical protein
MAFLYGSSSKVAWFTVLIAGFTVLITGFTVLIDGFKILIAGFNNFSLISVTRSGGSTSITFTLRFFSIFSESVSSEISDSPYSSDGSASSNCEGLNSIEGTFSFYFSFFNSYSNFYSYLFNLGYDIRFKFFLLSEPNKLALLSGPIYYYCSLISLFSKACIWGEITSPVLLFTYLESSFLRIMTFFIVWFKAFFSPRTFYWFLSAFY